MRRLIFILLFLGAGPAGARLSKSKPYLVRTPLTLNPQTEIDEIANPEPDVPMGTKLFVKPAHRQALLSRMSGLSLESERLKAAFAIYVEARLEGFDPEVRTQIQRIAANVTTRVMKSAKGEDAAGSHWRNGEIGIASWVKRGTLDYYIYLVHELEHVMQDEATFEDFKRKFYLMIVRTKKNKMIYRYSNELEATRAEFDFLRLIPKFLLPNPVSAEWLPRWQSAQDGDFAFYHKTSKYSSRQDAEPWTR